MRLVLIVIASGALSFAAALALVYAASHWLPCFDDQASCGMGEVYGVLGSMINVPLALIVVLQWVVLRAYLRRRSG